MKKKSRIHFFNSYLQGGAANSAINLFNQLCHTNKIDFKFYYMAKNLAISNQKQHFDTNFIQHNIHRKKSNYFSRLKAGITARLYYRKIHDSLLGRPNDLEGFSFPKQFIKTPYSYFGNLPDLIHLHWISEWLDYPSFFESIPNDMPIVWTLHDMNPFTGGCHFVNGCNKYVNNCEDCPQLNGTKNPYISQTNNLVKFKILKEKNITIVSPSYWLKKQAESSHIFNSFKTIHIPYGVDTEKFRPLNKIKTKKELNIDPKKTVLLFVADSVKNRRKGFQILINALSKKNLGDSILFLIVGDLSKKFELKINHRVLGHIKDPEYLNKIYAASDYFIIPSIEDNLPNTLLEAFSSGTPSIGFKTGGIPDLIDDGKTGFLSDEISPDGLGQKIQYAIQNKKMVNRMSVNCRTQIEKKYKLQHQANSYLQLYTNLLNK